MKKTKNRTQLIPKLRARTGNLKEKATRYVAKSEILQFRLDEETYEGLYGIAQRERKPVGTLVREWVTGMVKEEAADYNPGSRRQLVSRRGKAAVELQPDPASEKAQRLKAINELMEFRRTMPKIPLKELLEGRHKGHKY
jgi:hypothetical protein